MYQLAIKAAESSSSSTVESFISFLKASATRYSAVGDVGNEPGSTVT